MTKKEKVKLMCTSILNIEPVLKEKACYRGEYIRYTDYSKCPFCPSTVPYLTTDMEKLKHEDTCAFNLTKEIHKV